MTALPAPRPLTAPRRLPDPPPHPPQPATPDPSRCLPSGKRLSARTRYVLAMEAADTARAELGAAALEGAPVQRLAELLANLARLEARVTVADHRNGLVVKLATAAGRVIR